MDFNCLGIHCPVKNTCKRFTQGSGRKIAWCSSQRKYVQDESKVNWGCK